MLKLKSLCLIAILIPALAAAQAARATIQGTIKDATGATLPGATVEVKNVATGVAQTVVADGQGRYAVPELIVGDYEVTATLQGFRTVVQRGVSLSVGAQRVLDFELQLGALEESITVQSTVSQVDVVSAAVTTTIDQKQIAELPLNGRNYAQLILLAPGVQSSEQLHHLVATLGIESAGGLVGQDDPWVVDQAAGNRHALLLAAGELVRMMSGAVR